LAAARQIERAFCILSPLFVRQLLTAIPASQWHSGRWSLIFHADPFAMEASTNGFEFRRAYARARITFKAARFRAPVKNRRLCSCEMADMMDEVGVMGQKKQLLPVPDARNNAA
jgi:hypothetical protein